jgi:hypothetical protein
MLKIHLPHIKTRYHVHDVSNEVIAFNVKKEKRSDEHILVWFGHFSTTLKECHWENQCLFNNYNYVLLNEILNIT